MRPLSAHALAQLTLFVLGRRPGMKPALAALATLVKSNELAARHIAETLPRLNAWPRG